MGQKVVDQKVMRRESLARLKVMPGRFLCRLQGRNQGKRVPGDALRRTASGKGLVARSPNLAQEQGNHGQHKEIDEIQEPGISRGLAFDAAGFGIDVAVGGRGHGGLLEKLGPRYDSGTAPCNGAGAENDR